MDAPEKRTRKFGVLHWIAQTTPPCLILVALFATDSGTSLVFVLGLFIIPVLVSFVSILLKLFDLRNRKFFLARPGLTIAFFAAAFLIAQWSYEAALGQATDAAELLHEQCNAAGTCPANPSGWTVDGNRISRRDIGLFHKYSASYSYDPYYFDIRVYQGPDLGHYIRGGVEAPVSVALYEE